MKKIIYALLSYIVASVMDVSLTYYMVSTHRFYECNPFTRTLLPHPLLLFLREILFIALLVALVSVALVVLEQAGYDNRELASLIPLAPAVVRWMAVLHNLLLLFGAHSPFTVIFHS